MPNYSALSASVTPPDSFECLQLVDAGSIERRIDMIDETSTGPVPRSKQCQSNPRDSIECQQFTDAGSVPRRVDPIDAVDATLLEPVPPSNGRQSNLSKAAVLEAMSPVSVVRQ